MRVGTSSADANVSSPLTDPLWFEGLDARVIKKKEKAKKPSHQSWTQVAQRDLILRGSNRSRRIDWT